MYPIFIVIPAYNESKAILSILERIKKTMDNKYQYRILVIDDCSQDDTYNILRNSTETFDLRRNTTNLGKGQCLKQGFNLAKNDEIVVMIDADGEHPPEEIPSLLEPILKNQADIVIGSRFLSLHKDRAQKQKSSYLKNQKEFSHIRKFGNRVISLLISIFHGRYISDSQCGFRAFSPGFAKLMRPKYSRFAVETEMTIQSIQNGHRIVEIPIDTGLSTRESHMRIIRDSLQIFLVIFAMKCKKSQKWLHRLFPKYLDTHSQRRSENNSKQALEAKLSMLQHSERKVSIIIPCYNESKTILNVVHKIHELHLKHYEIIIVDDGSTDDSVDLLKQTKNIKIITHNDNLGYGKALINGILQSTGDIIITIDSDGQHDPGDIPGLCEPILQNKADLVVGSRYKGSYSYRIPFINRAGEAFVEIMLRIFFDHKNGIKNNQGGFRAFNHKTVKIFKEITFHGMTITTEILILALQKGFRVLEAPITLKDRLVGKSRVRKVVLLGNILYCFFYYYVKSLNSHN
jgi:glycosyltransferase involved in cell wall biosynthesis